MKEFLMNYGGTVLVSALIISGLFFAIRKMIKDRKNGRCGCGDCDGCAFKENCHKSNQKY